MSMMPSVVNNQILSHGPVSQAFLEVGISNFLDAVNWVHQLSYGRNSNRSDYMLLFQENRGTCSTKHAALAALTEEHGLLIQLKLVICKLDRNFDAKIGWLLDRLAIDYLPEAHCYLSYEGRPIDATFPNRPLFPEIEILEEHTISSSDIGDLKLTVHKNYLLRWMKESGLVERVSFGEVWRFREQWINSIQ